MTSTILILGIHTSGLLFALGLGAWLSSRAPSTPEVRRLSAAVERAGLSFLWGQYRSVAIATGATLVLLLAAAATLGLSTPHFSTVEAAFWLGLTFVIGGVSACASVHFAARLALRANGGVATTCASSTDAALSLASRSGGIAAMLTESLAALGFLGTFALAFVMKGGLGAEDPGALALDAARLASGHALGAALAATLIHRGASILDGSASVSAHHRLVGLTDTRNPAAVSRLLGASLGAGTRLTSDLFLSASLGNAVALAVAAGVLASNPAAAPLAVLPLLVRAFGALSVAFGTGSMRVTERENPTLAFIRGGVASLVTLIGGATAAAVWLSGGAGTLPAVLSILVAIAVVLAASWAFERMRRSGTSSEAKTPTLVALRLARACAYGLRGLPATVLLIAAALLSVWWYGAMRAEATKLPDTPLLLEMLLVAAVLSVAPLLFSLQLAGTVFHTAQGMLSIVDAPADSKQRAARLAAAQDSLAPIASTALNIAGGVTALLGALLLRRWLAPSSTAAESVDPWLGIWCASLGAAAAAAFSGSGLLGVSRGAQRTSSEVDRQLAAFHETGSAVEIPTEFAPSYRSCIDALHVEPRKNLLTPLGFILGVPIGLTASIAALFESTTAASGLAAFAVVASIGGLVAALAADAAATTLVTADRRSSSPSPRTTQAASEIGSLLRTCGPLAQVFAKATVMTGLAAASFLI